MLNDANRVLSEQQVAFLNEQKEELPKWTDSEYLMFRASFNTLKLVAAARMAKENMTVTA